MTAALASPSRESDFLLVGEDRTLNWPYLVKGVHSFIILAEAEHLSCGEIAPFFVLGQERYARRQSATRHRHSQKLLDDLQNFIASRDLSDHESRVYAEAIAELQKSYYLSEVESCPGQRDISDVFTWVVIVADDFLPLLKAQTQAAITIFAYFCALFKRVQNQWWVNGWTEDFIAKAYSLLDPTYRLWIQWPMAEIGWNPVVDCEKYQTIN